MHLGPPPRVTVALPLFRSAKFIDTIRGNLRRLPRGDLEILISDRHLYDDTIDRLESEFGADPRVRFIRHTDRIGWVAHYNALLREANGEFMMWMPHDDDFPEEYIPKLLSALKAHPGAILAFSSMRAVGRFGRPLRVDTTLIPEGMLAGPWTRRLHLCLLAFAQPAAAFRGVFRRQRIIEHGLFIRESKGSVLADHYWTFATGFVGSWVHVADCTYDKRFYPQSTHPRWRFSRRQWADGFRVLRAYIRALAHGRRDAAFSMLAVSLWVGANMLNTGMRNGAAPPAIARSLLLLTRRWLHTLLRSPGSSEAALTLIYW